jgi:Flp pilus assembly protein TadB
VSEQHLRLSDAERDEATTALAEHYALGRLTAEEHAERLDQIWAARTRGDLVPIFRDLPGHGTRYAATTAPRPTPRRGADWSRGRVAPFHRGLPTPLLVVLAVLVVLTIATHLPLVLLGVLVWFFVISRHRRRDVSRRW